MQQKNWNIRRQAKSAAPKRNIIHKAWRYKCSLSERVGQVVTP